MTRTRFLTTIVVCVICGFAALGVLAINTCAAQECFTHVTADNESQFVEHGRALISAGDYENGEAVLGKILAYDPRNYDALVALAGQMRHRGRYAESEALFNRAADVEPTNAFLYIDIGKLYRNMHEPDKAIEAFKKAESLDPMQAKLWSYGYAELYVTTREFGKAEASDRHALALDPKDPYTYMSLGNIYREEHRYDEAEAMYLKSIALDRHSEAYFGLGFAYIYQKKFDDAQIWFQKYIDEFPAPRGEVYTGLAQVALQRGEYFKSIRDFEYAHYLDRASFPAERVQGPLSRMKQRSRLLWLEGEVYDLLVSCTVPLFKVLGIRS